MKIDLHIHSIASGHALSSVYEIISFAKDNGLTHIGITEHGPAMEGAPHEGYFDVYTQFPNHLYDVNIYLGVEANILDINGKLDISSNTASYQKVISAGIHERTPYNYNDTISNTEAIINTITNSRCHIITHPYREHVKTNLSEIADAATKKGVLLEINNRIFSSPSQELLDEYNRMIKIIKSNKGFVIIGSDSHILETIGDDSAIQKYASYIGLTDEVIINNKPDILGEFIP